jgi:hypothetical protein
MSGKGNKGGQKGQRRVSKEEAPAIPLMRARVAIRRSLWQRFWDLVLNIDGPTASEPMLLNPGHDLGENRSSPNSFTADSASILKLRERVDAMEVSLRELFKLSERVNALDETIYRLCKKVTSQEFSSDENLDRTPKRNYDDFSHPISPPIPPSPPPSRGQQPAPAAPNRAFASEPTVEIETLARAVEKALAGQTSAGLEIESLLAGIRDQVGRIDVEYIGQRVTGQWQIAALVLPSTGEGLAIVSPGGLADSEVMNFFEVDFGRRIFACIQAARVVRSGQQISVSRKGRVESS